MARESPYALLRWALTGSAVRLAGSGLGFLATFLVTAALGPAQSGLLFGTISWSLALTILARWGSNDRIMIELSPLKGGWRQAAIAGFVNREIVLALRRCVIILSLILAGWLVAGAFAARPALSLPLLLTLTPATLVLHLFTAACKALRYLTAAFFFELVVQPLVVILTVVAAMETGAGIGFDFLATTYLCATIAAAASCLAVALPRQWHARRLKGDPWRGDERSRNFALIEIANYVAAWLPILILPFLVPPAEVGVFNLAFRIVGAVALVTTTINILAIPPLAIARRNRDSRAWRQAVRQARLAMAGASFLFILFAWGVGPLILHHAGEEFSVAREPMIILALFFALGTAMGPGGAILSVIGEERAVRNVNLVTTTIGIAAFYPAVEIWGIDAAAFVTGGSFLALKAWLLRLEIRTGRELERKGFPV